MQFHEIEKYEWMSASFYVHMYFLFEFYLMKILSFCIYFV